MRYVVLIAHKNRELVESYLDALDDAGFSCVTTDTGSGALETALSYKPQVAIIEAELPEVQGTDVCLRLKQEDATQKISVVLLGADSPQERFVSTEVGANVFMVEPVAAPQIVATVRELCSALEPS
ncbi:MAG: response regulator [Deltaproteobacteria bacterium]|nr:response regulator [Deltaproteobacteria bacterium]